MIPFLKPYFIEEYPGRPFDNKLEFYLIYTGRYFDLLLVWGSEFWILQLDTITLGSHFFNLVKVPSFDRIIISCGSILSSLSRSRHYLSTCRKMHIKNHAISIKYRKPAIWRLAWKKIYHESETIRKKAKKASTTRQEKFLLWQKRKNSQKLEIFIQRPRFLDSEINGETIASD